MFCTGYTSLIVNGEVTTGKDFLKACLRQFAVLIDMRDEPLSANIPDKIKCDDFCKQQKEKLFEEVSRLKSLTPEEWENEFQRKKDDILSQCENIRGAILSRTAELLEGDS